MVLLFTLFAKNVSRYLNNGGRWLRDQENIACGKVTYFKSVIFGSVISVAEY